MEYHIENGRLTFKLDDTEREELAMAMQNPYFDTVDSAALDWLLEQGLRGNGWDALRPEAIGALTDAPILGKGVVYGDAGDVTDVEQIFWFPAYETQCFGEQLVGTGCVSFPEAANPVPAPARSAGLRP